MREIKFRIWDEENKQMKFSTLFSFAIDFTPREQYCPIMQYTGLKDKNGKEIYEGDVVFNGNKNYAVEFGQYYSDGYYEHHGWTIDDNFDSFQPERYKIIGNIYENPELVD